jgi:Predicted metal-binding integral membrane protein (DUF2182)
VTAARLLPGHLRGARARGPGWSSEVRVAQIACVLAWLLLLAAWMAPVGAPAHGSSPVWWCMASMSPVTASGVAGSSGGLLAGVPGWLLMCVAMTWPGALPAAQHVAVNSFRRHRAMAVGSFLAVYLLVWLGLGLAAQPVTAWIAGAPRVALFSVLLALAAGYELTPAKGWALNRCHRSVPLPPSGRRRVPAVARFAWLNGSGCVASCWVSMVAMLLAPVGRPLTMAALAVAMTYGRLTRRPRAGRTHVAAGYTGVAALFALAAF